MLAFTDTTAVVVQHTATAVVVAISKRVLRQGLGEVQAAVANVFQVIYLYNRLMRQRTSTLIVVSHWHYLRHCSHRSLSEMTQASSYILLYISYVLSSRLPPSPPPSSPARQVPTRHLRYEYVHVWALLVFLWCVARAGGFVHHAREQQYFRSSWFLGTSSFPLSLFGSLVSLLACVVVCLTCLT